MNENELNALFDIEEEIDDEVQDGVVDREGEATDEGIEESEEELTEEDSIDGAANHQQSPEINRIFAELRRNSEQEIRNARSEAESARAETRVLTAALESFGYSGSPQEIADAIEASRTQRSIEEIEEERLRREEMLNEQIANHPDVVRAREMMRTLVEQRNSEMFAKELRAIQRLNPEIKSLSDLRNLGEDQNYFDFLIKEKGLHIDAAYKEITRNKTSLPQRKPDTRDGIGTFNGSDGKNTLDIPKDVEELCLQMNPGISKEEIRKYYNKYQKGAKR